MHSNEYSFSVVYHDHNCADTALLTFAQNNFTVLKECNVEFLLHIHIEDIAASLTLAKYLCCLYPTHAVGLMIKLDQSIIGHSMLYRQELTMN